MRRLIITASLTLLLSGCYDVTYPKQYKCRTGETACPDGYKCDEQGEVCVIEGPKLDKGVPHEQGTIMDGPVSPPDGSPPLPGVEAHWRLDEGSGGTAKDSSGNNKHGTVSYVDGKDFAWESQCMINGCGSFFGNGAHISTPFAPVIDPKGSFTLSAWVKTTAAQTVGVLGFKTQNDGALELTLELGKGGKFLLVDNQNKEVTVSFTEGVQDGAWHNLVVVRDGAPSKKTITIYVDGKQIASGEDPTTGKANEAAKQTLSLGAINSETGNAQHSFQGQIDDVQVYLKALTKQDVGRIYNQGY